MQNTKRYCCQLCEIYAHLDYANMMTQIFVVLVSHTICQIKTLIAHNYQHKISQIYETLY